MSIQIETKDFRRYVVDGVEHHVPQDQKEEFESIVNSAGKQFRKEGFYSALLSEYEKNRNNSQDATKVYHPLEGLNVEAITGKQQTEAPSKSVLQIKAAQTGIAIASREIAMEYAEDNKQLNKLQTSIDNQKTKLKDLNLEDNNLDKVQQSIEKLGADFNQIVSLIQENITFDKIKDTDPG